MRCCTAVALLGTSLSNRHPAKMWVRKWVPVKVPYLQVAIGRSNEWRQGKIPRCPDRRRSAVDTSSDGYRFHDGMLYGVTKAAIGRILEKHRDRHPPMGDETELLKTLRELRDEAFAGEIDYHPHRRGQRFR